MLESNNSRPTIDKPNLGIAKIVTGLTAIFLFLSIFINYLSRYASIEIIEIFQMLTSGLILTTYFFLIQYLKNFERTRLLCNCFYTYISLCLFFILMRKIIPPIPCEGLAMRIIPSLCFLLLSVLLGYIATRLIVIKDDHVGGLRTIGYLMFGMALLRLINTLAIVAMTVLVAQGSGIEISPIVGLISNLYIIANLMDIGMLVYLIVIYMNAEKHNEMLNI